MLTLCVLCALPTTRAFHQRLSKSLFRTCNDIVWVFLTAWFIGQSIQCCPSLIVDVSDGLLEQLLEACEAINYCLLDQPWIIGGLYGHGWSECWVFKGRSQSIDSWIKILFPLTLLHYSRAVPQRCVNRLNVYTELRTIVVIQIIVDSLWLNSLFKVIIVYIIEREK